MKTHRFDIITIFPEMFESPFDESILTTKSINSRSDCEDGPEVLLLVLGRRTHQRGSRHTCRRSLCVYLQRGDGKDLMGARGRIMGEKKRPVIGATL